MNCDCVVDASVAVKLFLVEELSKEARELFATLAIDPSPRFLVPELFFLECVHAFVKYSRKPAGYPEEQVWESANALSSLNLVKVPLSELIEPALHLTRETKIGTFDAIYVALAKKESLPFVTADDKLLRILGERAATLNCHHLRSFNERIRATELPEPEEQ